MHDPDGMPPRPRRGEGVGVVSDQLWLYCIAIAGLVLCVMVIVVLDGRRKS